MCTFSFHTQMKKDDSNEEFTKIIIEHDYSYSTCCLHVRVKEWQAQWHKGMDCSSDRCGESKSWWRSYILGTVLLHLHLQNWYWWLTIITNYIFVNRHNYVKTLVKVGRESSWFTSPVQVFFLSLYWLLYDINN